MFFIHLRAGGRANINTWRLPFWAPHPTAATRDIRTEMGRLVAKDESDAPLLSLVEIDVSIRSDWEQFDGKVIAADDDLLTIEVSRSRGSEEIVLTDRTGHFAFGNPGAAFVAAKKLIQRATCGNRANNWLKDILLAHDNNIISIKKCYLTKAKLEQHFFVCDKLYFSKPLSAFGVFRRYEDNSPQNRLSHL